MTASPACRFCKTPLTHTLVDLGSTPLANSYLPVARTGAAVERSFPLHARVCSKCFLVQVDDAVPPSEIFSDYAYFSSYSASWIEHARRYADMMRARFGLNEKSLVVEIASNDGYLLQHFRQAGVPVLGIEPAANVAAAAIKKGVATEVMFFGETTARTLEERGDTADLMAANNVFAHVPEILDFAKGFAVLLKPQGVATFEFPHVLNLIADIQFDTIYHEHYSYLSLVSVEKILQAAGLRAFDVEELPTHGGSLRLFVCKREATHKATPRLDAARAKESAAKLDRLDGYTGFAPRVIDVKMNFMTFLAGAKLQGKRVAAYGAAAKGNTFLNTCGVTANDIVCVFDRSLEKQGKMLPGSHLPILAPERIGEIKPDYLLILPWNLASEIKSSMAGISEWGGRFVTALPDLVISDT